MAVETKTIKMRRGLEAELERSKLLSGEFGIATDTKKVFIGMGSGQSKELASREDVQTLIDNFGNVVDAEIEYAKNEIREEGERVLSTIPNDFEEVARKADEAVRTKSDAIIITKTGDHITHPMTSEDPIRGLKLYGKGEQRKTTGAQLFNADLIPSKTSGGVTVTNNGDGSFTISGNGITTGVFSAFVDYSHEESVKILKSGKISIRAEQNTQPYVYAQIRNSTGLLLEVSTYGNNKSEGEILEGYFTESTFLRIGFYSAMGVDITNTTLKPMLYQEGDGTWEPYTGGQPSPSPEYPQEIETCGKVGNLLEVTAGSATNNGVTFTVNDDGSVTVKGTATGQIIFNLNYVNNATKVIPTGKYKLSGGISSNVRVDAIVSGKEAAICTGTDVEFDVKDEDTNSWVRILLKTGVTVDTTIYPMITPADSNITSYRPYNGGQREIATEVLTGNFLDITDGSETLNGITVERKGGIITVSGTPQSTDGYTAFYLGKVRNIKAGVYTMQLLNKIIGVGITVDTKPSGVVNLTLATSSNEKTGNVASLNTGSVNLNVSNSLTGIKLTLYPMLNIGEVALPFEPYKEPQQHITTVPNGLPGIEVTDASLANYVDDDGRMWCCDEVDYERGVYVQRVNVADFKNAVGNRIEIPSGTGRYRLDFTYVNNPNFHPCKSSKKGMCTALTATEIVLGDNTLDNAISCYRNGGIYIRCDRFKTAGEFVEWAKETNLEYHYILATPIETPLPTSEIAAYRALHSNYPTTNVSNDCNAGMEVSANADLKMYIDSKIAEISTAILNN